MKLLHLQWNEKSMLQTFIEVFIYPLIYFGPESCPNTSFPDVYNVEASVVILKSKSRLEK